jgi:hypothetical protein
MKNLYKIIVKSAIILRIDIDQMTFIDYNKSKLTKLKL